MEVFMNKVSWYQQLVSKMFCKMITLWEKGGGTSFIYSAHSNLDYE